MPIRAVRLRRARRAAVILLAVALSACAPVRRGAAAPPAATLYARLGGYEALAAVADDFLGRVMADARLAPFFKGLDEKDMRRTRQHIVDLLCNATAGPCFYPGRDMKSVHAQLEITGDVWNAFTGHFNETFAKFRIGERERNELVTIIGSLRADIVNK